MTKTLENEQMPLPNKNKEKATCANSSKLKKEKLNKQKEKVDTEKRSGNETKNKKQEIKNKKL